MKEFFSLFRTGNNPINNIDPTGGCEGDCPPGISTTNINGGLAGFFDLIGNAFVHLFFDDVKINENETRKIVDPVAGEVLTTTPDAYMIALINGHASQGPLPIGIGVDAETGFLYIAKGADAGWYQYGDYGWVALSSDPNISGTVKAMALWVHGNVKDEKITMDNFKGVRFEANVSKNWGVLAGATAGASFSVSGSTIGIGGFGGFGAGTGFIPGKSYTVSGNIGRTDLKKLR